MTDKEQRMLRRIRYARWLIGLSLIAMLCVQIVFGRDFAGLPFLVYAGAMGALALVCFALVIWPSNSPTK